MKFKTAIAIKLLLVFLIFGFGANAQKNTQEILSVINKYLTSYNDDSICWIYKKPINSVWVEQLNLEMLLSNWGQVTFKGKLDSINTNPFDPFPIDKILNSADIMYMKKCALSLNNNYWKRKSFSNKETMILKNRVRLPLRRNSRNIEDYFEISHPLFSVNGNVAILHVNHLCGMECGSGFLIVLRKIDGFWEKVCIIDLWIS